MTTPISCADSLPRSARAKTIYGLIHADLHVGNILYHPDDGFCILDFDQCALGWRAYDVATFLYNIRGDGTRPPTR